MGAVVKKIAKKKVANKKSIPTKAKVIKKTAKTVAKKSNKLAKKTNKAKIKKLR